MEKRAVGIAESRDTHAPMARFGQNRSTRNETRRTCVRSEISTTHTHAVETELVRPQAKVTFKRPIDTRAAIFFNI